MERVRLRLHADGQDIIARVEPHSNGASELRR